MTIIPQLERDLSTVAARRLSVNPGPASGVGRRSRVFAARAAIALSIAAVLLIAALALSLRHGSTTSAPAGPATVQSTRRELIRVLGILRTPQTSAAHNPAYDVADGMDSRLFEAVARLRSRLRGRNLTAHERANLQATLSNMESGLARFGYARLDSSLVRVVQAPYDETVALDPVSQRPSAGSRQRVEELGLSLLLPGSDPTGLSPQPVSALLAHGLNSFTYAGHANVGFFVVPDGVAKLTLGPIHLALGNLTSPVQAPIPATTAIVHDNIASFRLPVPTVSPWSSVPPGRGGMSSSGAYVRETWLGPNGQVMKHATVLIAFNFIIHQ